MARTLILTFIADDRPGLVEQLASTVTSHGGNWLESRMAHLAAKFAGIARVEVSPDEAGALQRALAALSSEGIAVTAEQAAPDAPAGPGTAATLDLVGPDHPGIVQDIAHCLAARSVTIDEMETRIEATPMGGGNLFYASVHVRVPQDVDEERLRYELEQLGAVLMVDIMLREETG